MRMSLRTGPNQPVAVDAPGCVKARRELERASSPLPESWEEVKPS